MIAYDVVLFLLSLHNSVCEIQHSTYSSGVQARRESAGPGLRPYSQPEGKYEFRAHIMLRAWAQGEAEASLRVWITGFGVALT